MCAERRYHAAKHHGQLALMRKLLILALLLMPTLAWGQASTLVTGTATDSQATPYVNGTWTANLVNPSAAQPLWNGNANFVTAYSGSLDSTGSLSVSLPSNTGANAITVGGASTTSWRFNICASDGESCFVTSTIQVTGASQSISATLTNAGRISFGLGEPNQPTCAAGQVVVSLGGNLEWGCGAAGGSGTVTSVSAGTLSPLFTTSVATPTTTPAISFTPTNAGANTVLGNATGSPTAPTYAQVVQAQVTNGYDDLSSNQTIAGNKTLTGTTLAGSLNNVIVVDGVKYATIQAALNAVATPGSEVFVPCGTYTLASGLTWPSLPVNLHGEDRNCTILNFTITSGVGMSPWYGSSVHGLDIRGANSGTAIGINGGAAVWATSQSYTVANNNLSPTLANANGLIFGVIGSCTSSTTTEPIWPTVLGGTVTPGGTDTCTYKALWIAAKHIYDDIVEQWGGQAINSGGYSYGDSYHDNIIRNGLTEAVLLGVNSQKISFGPNNVVDNFATDGVDINGIKHTVIGDHFSRIGVASAISDRTAINLFTVAAATPVTDIKVIGNDIHLAGTGIHTTGVNGGSMSRIVFIGNTIDTPSGTASAGDGIDIDCSTGTTMTYNDIVISGNTVTNAQRWGYCVYGGGTATVNNVVITGNTARGSTTGDLALNQVIGTIVADNEFLSATPYPSFSDTTFSTLWGQNSAAASSIASSFLNNNYLWWRNAAASGGLLILGVDGSNQVQLRGGGGANSLQLMSQSGTTRFNITEPGAMSLNGTLSATLAGPILLSSTIPTIAGAGCGGTVAAIQNANGTASFNIFTGTAPTSGGCTITMPAATTDWHCEANHTSAISTTNFIIQQTGALSTTSVTLQLFSDVAAATAPAASDTWRTTCTAN
jgi:hypothetical protein